MYSIRNLRIIDDMKTKRDHFCFVLKYTVPMVTIMVLSLISPRASLAEEECSALLTNRCETCHYLTRVCQKVDEERNKKSWFGNPAGTWKRIIKNMVKQGAQLNSEEESVLVECLSKPTQEVLEFCKLDK